MKLYRGKHSFILVLFICLLITIENVPYLTYRMPIIVKLILIVGSYLLLLRISEKKFLDFFSYLLPFALFFFVDALFDTLVGKSFKIGAWFFNLMSFFLFPMVTMSIIKKNDLFFAKIVILVYFLSFTFTSVTTYLGCETFPGASRALANVYSTGEQEYVQIYKLLNIGGFEYVYSLVLLFPLLIFVIRNKEGNFFLRIISIIAYVWYFMVIIRVEYTTAMFCSVLSAVLFFLGNYNNKKFLGILAVTSIILFILRDVVGDFLIGVSSLFESGNISNRLEDLGSVIQGESTISSSGYTDIDSRQDKYLISWNAFLRSPLVGTGTAVGGHSFVLMYMAKYGLFGLIFTLYLLTKIFRYSIQPYYKDRIYNYIMALFFIQVILVCLNPLIIYQTFLFIIPLFCLIYNQSISNTK